MEVKIKFICFGKFKTRFSFQQNFSLKMQVNKIFQMQNFQKCVFMLELFIKFDPKIQTTDAYLIDCLQKPSVKKIQYFQVCMIKKIKKIIYQ